MRQCPQIYDQVQQALPEELSGTARSGVAVNCGREDAAQGGADQTQAQQNQHQDYDHGCSQ